MPSYVKLGFLETVSNNNLNLYIVDELVCVFSVVDC